MVNVWKITDVIVAIIFVYVVASMLALITGCASQASKEDSTHYKVQAEPQGYPCPECGFSIPMKDISSNIRVENKCPNCGEVFFGIPVAKKTQENEGKRGEKVVSSGLKSHGPRSVYESDTDYQYFWVGGEYFKETETGYSLLYWHSRDSKVKIRRVIPHWTTTNLISNNRVNKRR